MALTPSTMLPLGTPLPIESMLTHLEAVHGPALTREALEGQPVLVLFLCAHCPFVKHIEPELSRLDQDLTDTVRIVAISSNSIRTHPQDGPEGLREQARLCSWSFPYLFDADQSVARAFRAACTPDLYLFDAEHQLVYRGQLDGSRPGSGRPPDGEDLRRAITALRSGARPSADQTPSIGCNIKWHPGTAPEWA